VKKWHASTIAMLAATSLWTGVARTAEQSAPQVIALADSYVAEYTKTFPEMATFSGVKQEHNDGLSDNSLAALKRWQVLEDG
jgi:hypothetical protein